jgi:hypothetical protein
MLQLAVVAVADQVLPLLVVLVVLVVVELVVFRQIQGPDLA